LLDGGLLLKLFLFLLEVLVGLFLQCLCLLQVCLQGGVLAWRLLRDLLQLLLHLLGEVLQLRGEVVDLGVFLLHLRL
jgi:hypothetical protein